MKYVVIQELLPKFESKMHSFVKKFSKNGEGSFKYIKSEPYICEDKNDSKFGSWVVDVEVDAFYKIGDYRFVAALEWVDDANENIIKKLSPDIYVPSIYKNRRECDHCKTDRKRKFTILLKNSLNEYIQVGKSCVKEYTGMDIGNYARYLSFFDDLDSYLIECEKENTLLLKKEYELDKVLACAFEDVKENGYISKIRANETGSDSTAYRVYAMIVNGVSWAGSKILFKNINVESNRDKISELKQFYNNLTDSNNDYTNNIKTILQSKWVSSNNIALVVSAIGTKLRIENENLKAKNSNSSHIGAIGDKISFVAKPECIYASESAYGVFRVYKMLINEFDEIIWKTNKYLNTDLTHEFKATIKGHEEYKGIKQTEITRARTSVISQ